MKTLYIISCPLIRFINWSEDNKLDFRKLNILIKRSGFNNEEYSFQNIHLYNTEKLDDTCRDTLKDIQNESYDEIIFFYNNPFKKGYEDLISFCLKTGVSNIKAVNTDDSISTIKRSSAYLKASIEIIFTFLDSFTAILLVLICFPPLLLINVFSIFFLNKRSILFSGVGGRCSASFRIRCEKFAEKTLKHDLQASSFDFWFLDHKFIQEKKSFFLNFYDSRRIIFIISAWFIFNFKFIDFKNIYAQKIDLAAVAAYFSTLFTKRKLWLDLDDWDHDNFGELFKRFSVFPFFRYDNIFYLILNEATGVVAASEFLTNKIENMCSSKILYAPTAPDIEIFNYKHKQEDDLIKVSWLGTIYRKQSVWLKFILDIWKEIDQTNSILEIMGEGSFCDSVKKYAKNNNIENVNFIDWLPSEKVSDYLDEVDIGLFPIVNIGDYENAKSPTKLFEYMAKGIPCIVSKTVETSLVVNDGFSGFLCDNKHAFKEKLKLLINDREIRERTGRNARQIIEIFYNLDKSVNDIYEFIFEN